MTHSDNLISYYFDLNNTEVDSVGEEVFKKQLYQCMISQALELKGDIETRRASNTYGIIVWQYNEIWPTGGTRAMISAAPCLSAFHCEAFQTPLKPCCATRRFTGSTSCIYNGFTIRLGYDRVWYASFRANHWWTLEAGPVLVQEVNLC